MITFGGVCLLYSSTIQNHPFNHRIALAPVAVLSQAVRSIPVHFTRSITYAYNLYRAFRSKAFRDSISRMHMVFPPVAFFSKPSIVALPVRDSSIFNLLISQTPTLGSFINEIRLPTDIIFAEKDKRLLNATKHEKLYNHLEELCAENGVGWHLVLNVNHRFNLLPEEQLQLGYNNEYIMVLVYRLIVQH